MTILSITFFSKSVLSPLLYKTATLSEVEWRWGNKAEKQGLRSHRRMSYWSGNSSGILLFFSQTAVFKKKKKANANREVHAFCCAVQGCPWPCFLFLYYLHQRAARWLKEKMQKSLNPFFMNTVRKAFCGPFSSGELGCIWKCSEIKVNSWVQVPKDLCFFLKPNPSMFHSEDFYKMLLVCFPCPPVCHHCVSAWVLNLTALCERINYVLCFHKLFRRI